MKQKRDISPTAVLILVIFWFIVVATLAQMYADECPRLLGDVNCDFKVDIHDYLALDDFLNGGPEPADVEAGDMDQDGIINAVDCLLLAQKVGGIIR